MNAHNGQLKPNLRRKRRGVKWVGRPDGSSGSGVTTGGIRTGTGRPTER